jgi:hypothetical protein
MTSPSDFLDESECAQYLRVSVAWLRKDRRLTRTIPVMKLGKQYRYHRRSIECEAMRRSFIPDSTIAASFGQQQKGM